MVKEVQGRPKHHWSVISNRLEINMIQISATRRPPRTKPAIQHFIKIYNHRQPGTIFGTSRKRQIFKWPTNLPICRSHLRFWMWKTARWNQCPTSNWLIPTNHPKIFQISHNKHHMNTKQNILGRSRWEEISYRRKVRQIAKFPPVHGLCRNLKRMIFCSETQSLYTKPTSQLVVRRTVSQQE